MPLLSRTNRASRFETTTNDAGFSLIETLIAMTVLTFGLLAAGQLIYLGMSSTTLARSKGNATVAAQNKLDLLADLYRQNPLHTDLTNGTHGPEQVQVLNPSTSAALNRYNVSWNVTPVADPRPGKTLFAKQVVVSVTPIGTGTEANHKAGLNKIINVTGIFSPRAQ